MWGQVDKGRESRKERETEAGLWDRRWWRERVEERTGKQDFFKTDKMEDEEEVRRQREGKGGV